MEDKQKSVEGLRSLVLQSLNKAFKDEKTEINFFISDPSGITIDLKIKKESNTVNKQNLQHEQPE
jgi:hypothetical protein